MTKANNSEMPSNNLRNTSYGIYVLKYCISTNSMVPASKH